MTEPKTAKTGVPDGGSDEFKWTVRRDVGSRVVDLEGFRGVRRDGEGAFSSEHLDLHSALYQFYRSPIHVNDKDPIGKQDGTDKTKLVTAPAPAAAKANSGVLNSLLFPLAFSLNP